MVRKYNWMLQLEDYMEQGMVEEYGWKDAKEIALSNCSADVEKVREQFVGTDGLYGAKITSITFLEFDSTNPSHGCAHFEVEVEGTEEEHKKLCEALGEDFFGEDLE